MGKGLRLLTLDELVQLLRKRFFRFLIGGISGEILPFLQVGLVIIQFFTAVLVAEIVELLILDREAVFLPSGNRGMRPR